ncbi:LamG-like jellyroll fold domain-containing protein [Flavobacterium sp.]|uniref:LamG-like jellyroll fold domain-containing protein n=1 Tax=Flavobacterium sp. TaxID=239 RepID=UPI0026171C47|nr:LamG-like jellyroll fold domain-containing protein [Flavobacterium sp.]
MKKILLLFTLILVYQSFAQAPTSGLVAYFEFENSLASSTSSDVFMNTGNDNATFVAAAHGQGVSFNGSTTLLIPTLSESIVNSSNSFTISWWEYRPATTPLLNTYSVRLGQNVGFRYIGNSLCPTTNYSDRYQIDITTASNTSYCVTTNTHTGGNGGTWKHHTISKLNNVLKYYLNGVLAFVGASGKTLDVAGLSALTAGDFQLGYGTTSTTNMIGIIDDLALYKRELSAGEIATLYQSGNAGGLPTTTGVGDFSLSTTSQKIYYSVYGSGLNTTTKVYYGTTNPPNTSSSFVVGPNATNSVLYDKLNTTITGLTTGVQYYYRIEAVNTQGSNFSTQPTYTFVAGGSSTPVVNFPFDGNATSIDNAYTLNPISTSPSYVSNRNGQANKAVYLNNKKLSVDVPTLPVTSSPRTVSFWMKHQSTTDSNVFGWGTPSNNYAFGAFTIAGTSFTTYTGSTGFNTPINYDNNWHHYTITYDGNSFRTYLDGIHQFGTVNSISTQGTMLYIGGASGNTPGANGNDIYLDDFQVYNQWINDQGVYGLYLSQITSTLHSQSFQSKNLKASIYPNPTSDNFSIEMENEVKSVEIYSLQGQKVLTSTSKTIDISNLSKGIYLVQIEDENNNRSTQKLIVK